MKSNGLKEFKYNQKMNTRFSVLLLITIVNHAVSIKELQKLSGISYGTLRTHLNYLYYTGLVDRSIGRTTRDYHIKSSLGSREAIRRLSIMFLTDSIKHKPDAMNDNLLKKIMEIQNGNKNND